MVQNAYNDDVSLFPIKLELAGYSFSTFKQDLLAGFSVSFLAVPQAMACALLAGLPLYCGLFAAVFTSMIAAFFGSSRHLIVGPSNAVAILIQVATSEILFTYYRGIVGSERDIIALQIMIQITLVVGVLQLLAAFFRLGRLTQFVSHSVVVGYLAGVAVSLVVNQLFTFMGLAKSYNVHSVSDKLYYLFTHLSKVHIHTLFVGFGSMFLMIFFRGISKKIPSAVLTIVIASLALFVADQYFYQGASCEYPCFSEGVVQKVMVVGDTGDVYGIIPRISWPTLHFGLLNNILSVSFAIALLSIMETTSVAKSTAASSGQRLSVNQEIFGLGLSNLLSSFIGAMPVAGSASRTSFSYEHGAKTRLSSIIGSVFVGLTLYLFGPLISKVPLAALSAILIMSALGIVNRSHLRLCLKATRSDGFVLVTTFLACLFLSLDVAFYIGVILSIALYLKKAAIPQLIEYTIDEQGSLKNREAGIRGERQKIRVIKVNGELFFGAADLFQTTLKSIAEDDTTTRVIVLQLKNARDIDATACLALKQLHDYLVSSKRYLIACGLTLHIWEVLSDAGLVDLLGKENLFLFDERYPNLHIQKALAKAKKLVSNHEEEIPLEKPAVIEPLVIPVEG